jgi:hypothetical protein
VRSVPSKSNGSPFCCCQPAFFQAARTTTSHHRARHWQCDPPANARGRPPPSQGQAANFAPHDRDAIQQLALMLIGQLEMAEPLAWKIERTMDPPQPIPLLCRAACFGYRAGIDVPDQPPVAGPGRIGGERIADQLRQPIAAPSQAVEQAHVGDIHQAYGSRPGWGRATGSSAVAGSGPTRPGSMPVPAAAEPPGRGFCVPRRKPWSGGHRASALRSRRGARRCGSNRRSAANRKSSNG